MKANARLLAITFAALAIAGVIGLTTPIAIAGAAVTGFALGGLPVFLQAATLRAAPGAAEAASALKHRRSTSASVVARCSAG
jgi:hypothetical protein